MKYIWEESDIKPGLMVETGVKHKYTYQIIEIFHEASDITYYGLFHLHLDISLRKATVEGKGSKKELADYLTLRRARPLYDFPDSK